MRRITARMPITSAPTRARLVRPSAPGTHCAATVELPRQRMSRKTNTASGSVPDGSRRRCGIDLGQAASMSCCPLHQADRVPGPQQPGEVVALADDVQVDVRAEV